MSPPCVLAEDDHLLFINKPAGLNTHAPDPYAGEGIYEWLRHREARWASLAIIQRLDKETSGVLVFAKTPLANRSLTDQFSRRTVRKLYLLLTNRPVPEKPLTVRSQLVRAGDKYVSSTAGQTAETRFFPVPGDVKRLIPSQAQAIGVGACQVLAAEPLTGRTHQIRVHAAERGFAILGDTRYGGSPAARVCLHAAQLTLQHPATGRPVTFSAKTNFAAEPRLALRSAIIEPDLTTAYRVIHGASDGWHGSYVDKLGDYLLLQSEGKPGPTEQEQLATLAAASCSRGIYYKPLIRRVRQTDPASACPQLVSGEATPDRFVVLENGLKFELSFSEGYSAGLFLDQRDNRRRLLTGHVAAGFELYSGARRSEAPSVLNTFAYTCGFSVAAARAGAQTTSLDLSKKYLEWGQRNFILNQLDPAKHDFIFGDVFDWLRRLARQGRRFDILLLDPPTFSQSKTSGVFRAEKDYAKLVAASLSLLNPNGVLFASSNAAAWAPADFMATILSAIHRAGRSVVQQHYVTQPPDFPISRAEPGYLKTVWLRL